MGTLRGATGLRCGKGTGNDVYDQALGMGGRCDTKTCTLYNATKKLFYHIFSSLRCFLPSNGRDTCSPEASHPKAAYSLQFTISHTVENPSSNRACTPPTTLQSLTSASSSSGASTRSQRFPNPATHSPPVPPRHKPCHTLPIPTPRHRYRHKHLTHARARANTPKPCGSPACLAPKHTRSARGFASYHYSTE
jgi:hypothetical protein